MARQLGRQLLLEGEQLADLVVAREVRVQPLERDLGVTTSRAPDLTEASDPKQVLCSVK